VLFESVRIRFQLDSHRRPFFDGSDFALKAARAFLDPCRDDVDLSRTGLSLTRVFGMNSGSFGFLEVRLGKPRRR